MSLSKKEKFDINSLDKEASQRVESSMKELDRKLDNFKLRAIKLKIQDQEISDLLLKLEQEAMKYTPPDANQLPFFNSQPNKDEQKLYIQPESQKTDVLYDLGLKK